MLIRRWTAAGGNLVILEDGFMLRTLCSLAVLATILVCSTGCAGYGETYAERQHRWKSVWRQDANGLVEDIDKWLHTDRPARLTHWEAK